MTNQPSESPRSGHDFQLIGLSLPKIPDMPSTKETPSTKPNVLENTSPPTTERKATPAPTGTKVSLRGASKISASTAPQELAKINTAALMKAVMALLPPQLELRPVWRPAESDWDLPLAFKAVGTENEKSVALGVLSSTMKPLPVKEISRELTILNALTKRRKEDQGDMKLMIAAYVEKLLPYPGEAVVHVLRKWPETQWGKWWPSWAELYALLESRVAERRLMLEALN